MKMRVTLCTALVLLLAIAGAWAFGFIGGADPVVAELQQMRDQLFASRNLPEAQRDELRGQFRQRLEALSESQRRAVFESSREQWRQREQQRMDEFFAMSRAEQQKRLDESINRMLQRSGGQNQNAATGNREGRGGLGGDRGRGMTNAQREARAKQRLDRSTPKERAQRAEYRRRLQERLQQRGLNPQQFAGGRRGIA
jgi:hypothetical protein